MTSPKAAPTLRWRRLGLAWNAPGLDVGPAATWGFAIGDVKATIKLVDWVFRLYMLTQKFAGISRDKYMLLAVWPVPGATLKIF